MTTDEQYAAIAENYRTDFPVYWAILRGRSHINRIRLLTMLPDQEVKSQLKSLLKQKLVIQDKNHKHIFRVHPEEAAKASLKGLRKYLDDLEYSYAKTEGYKLELGELSSANQRRLAEERAEQTGTGRGLKGAREYYDDLLTVKQAQTLWLCLEVKNGQPFRPLDLGKAQGYSGPGYVNSTLKTLEKKGLVSPVPARVITWKLTEAGVDKAKEIRDSGKVERLA